MSLSFTLAAIHLALDALAVDAHVVITFGDFPRPPRPGSAEHFRYEPVTGECETRVGFLPQADY